MIAVFELTRAVQHVVERTLSRSQIFTACGLLYFVVCYGGSSISRRLERQLDPLSGKGASAWQYVIGER